MGAFRRWWVIVAVLVFGVATVPAQQTTSSETLYTESRPAMGTVFTIKCYMPDSESAEEVMDAAFEEIARVEALLSNYQPSSELSRISRVAGNGPVLTDPETFGFLTKSFDWSARSDGAFDITVGPLLRAWGFKARNGHVPTQAEQKRIIQVGQDATTKFNVNGTPTFIVNGEVRSVWANWQDLKDYLDSKLKKRT